jgi:hypothetical protein
MVAGFAEEIETEEILVEGARYVPNTQFLSVPFRSELIHSAAQVSELSDCTCLSSLSAADQATFSRIHGNQFALEIF